VQGADTTARRMGGVAGHAGVFSTAHDVSIYAQALLDRLAGRPSTFPLTQATLELMTTRSSLDMRLNNSKPRTTRPVKPSQRDRTPRIRSGSALPGDYGTGHARLGLGISILAYPRREARSFPSVALATQALPVPRCGLTRVRIRMSFCSRIRSMCEAVHRSRSCG